MPKVPNEHLVPQLILDLCDKFAVAKSDSERFNLEARLEAIRAFCDRTLKTRKG